jgi:hypothetical protein
MEEFVFLNNLFDCYGCLLTDKQRDYFCDYYQNDLTLGEIALNNGVSRNAIHNQLKETVKILKNYEEKLQLFEKNGKILEIASKIDDADIRNELERIIEG